MTTIHATVELYGSVEKRAFAKFLEASADADDARPKDKDVLGGIAGIVGSPFWKGHAAGEGETTGELTASETATLNTPQAAAPARVRGQPSPGKARRTKAEIAEDDAAAAAETTSGPITIVSQTDVKTEESNLVEDDAATQQADAADEAAETAASKPADAKPTIEDIRTVLGKYQQVYGIPACMEDGPIVLQEVCGEGVVKVSAVPEDKIADVIAALKKAGNENRFGRTAVAA